MSILKKEYELSVWHETLGENGQKEEKKQIIIGAHDMEFLGRATKPNLKKELKGTNTFTFQMPSKYFDSKVGDYVHNEFVDYLFNEQKLKLEYDGEWYEFYIKNIAESKQFKSIMYTYTCTDSFIDELSRNGYGITFDEELYNNVEELGTFTDTILEDSIWHYDASRNIGDFTEYSEEKLFKIPVNQFSKISGYKINYEIKNETITNVYTQKKRNLEMGDDLAREKKYFWDNGSFDNGFDLISDDKLIEEIDNDGYIYVPYNQLNFCYETEQSGDYAATEMPSVKTVNGVTSYVLAPSTIDPTKLIQFIAIPAGAEINIDESGLLVNKNFSYVMTVAQWNELIINNLFYWFEDIKHIQNGHKVVNNETPNYIHGNKCVVYDGYLDSINDIELNFGKSISITDRTEMNISEEVDQFVTVYNNNAKEYDGMFSSDEWGAGIDNYRVCSKIDTRQIIPQLARNLIQNGTSITDTNGWSPMIPEITNIPTAQITDSAATVNIGHEEISDDETNFWLELTASSLTDKVEETDNTYCRVNGFVNFGIVGQEVEISNEKTYYFKINGELINGQINTSLYLFIGEGELDTQGNYILSKTDSFVAIRADLNTEYLIKFDKLIKKPYIAVVLEKGQTLKLTEMWFFEAYTKGQDFFDNGYFRYSGRNIGLIDLKIGNWMRPSPELSVNTSNFQYIRGNDELNLSDYVLFETDIMEGDTYEYQRYFIQQLQFDTINDKNEKEKKYLDTFGAKKYLSDSGTEDSLPLPSYAYTEDDYKIVTNYIDMEKCPCYCGSVAKTEIDCKHTDNPSGVCMYQKYGYCPYLFKTQKHCRKIRTLKGEKSNRFNLTQELSKVFEVYPVYYTNHEENGKIKKRTITEDGKEYQQMDKTVFFMTEKGMKNKLGFRYEKNLSNIGRTFDSKEIVTKLYVEDVDSELSKTGLCSIKTAEDNPSKDNYIIDFHYYNMKGLLDEKESNRDLYGVDNEDMGYLKTLGYYNTEYDKLSNKIINLQDESYTELTANIEVNLNGIETAMQELNKNRAKMEKYYDLTKEEEGKEQSQTYENYKTTVLEQQSILIGLIKDTFFGEINGELKCMLPEYQVDEEGQSQIIFGDTNMVKPINYFDQVTLSQLKDYIYKYHPERLGTYGMIGQYITEYNQIQTWKKEREKYLKKINELSLRFYRKYEPFLKEGTWSDSNYLSDNSYYFGAKEVAKQGAIPKVTYNISVVDLAVLDEDYTFNIADTTYIEDIETFGINIKTGLPNRLKVIISAITYDLDVPAQNSITIQNYTTQFEDLFQQISNSVQSLSFNENIYKRSSNFTSTQNVATSSLQGTLDENNLTLLNTEESNIELDNTGQSGSDINNHNNKYKLNGEGLFFSNDGGEHWNTGVGPGGINADYIKTGTLDAGRIRIVDNNYLYFLWDKTGISAYREPYSIIKEDNTIETKVNFGDFSRFNKYGLSLVENGKIRLRAGYDYYSSESDHEGKIVSEDEQIKDNREIGFFLYNSLGEKIFSTSTANISSDNVSDSDMTEKVAAETAKISLKGEIYVTDSTLLYTNEQITQTYSNEYIFNNTSIERMVQIDNIVEHTVVDDLHYNIIIETDNFSNSSQLCLQQLSSFITENKIPLNTIFSCHITNIDKTISYDMIYRLDNVEEKNMAYGMTEFSDIITVYHSNIFTYSTGEIIDGNFTPSSRDTFSGFVVNNINNLYISENSQITVLVLQYKDDETVNIAGTSSAVSVSYYEKLPEFTEDVVEGVSPQQKNLYLVNNRYFEEASTVTTPEKETNGEVALYINNKISWDETRETKDQRLFSCCVNDSNNIINLFTIKKDGTLYMGGDIKDIKGGTIDSLLAMPDEIQIENSFLKISAADEKMYISFDNIYDPTGQYTLKDYVTDEVSSVMLQRHRHEIKQLNATIKRNDEDKETKYFYFISRKQWDAIKKMTVSIEGGHYSGTFEEWITKDFGNFVFFTETGMFAPNGIDKGEHPFVADIIIPIVGQKYDYACDNSYTEYEGSGTSGTRSFYAVYDPIDQGDV